MEDGFGLVVLMVVDYATGLLSYKERRYFLRTPVLEEDWGGGKGLNVTEGAVKLSD